jgi:LuxR family maltose regulon positive regulatory protein
MLDEVLARQRPEVQDFVLKASILDRFCASLCDALLDDRWSMTDPPGTMGKGASTHSLEMLNAIHHDNLFLLSLDPQGTWYRFHHLFQDLLRQRLEDRTPAAELAALHARASAWFVEQGLVDEALVHALAAGDVARAAEIVEQSRHDAIFFGRCHLLERWSERLPEDIQGQRPELLLAQAWVLFHHFDLQLIPAVLEKAEQALAEEGSNDRLQGEIDFFRGYFSYFQGQAAQAIQYHTSARQKIPETVPMFKAEAELHYALSLHMNGLKERALDGLSDWIHSSRTSEGVIRARAWAGLAFIHLLEGDLGPAAYAVRHWVELAEEARDPFVETWGSYLDALMHVYGGEPDRAVQGFEPLVAQRHIMQSRVATDILCALSLAYEHGQRPDQADGVVRLLLEFARHTGDPAYRTIASSCQARLSLLRGDMASALRWLRTADLATDAGIMLWWVEVPRLTACRVLVAEGSEASLQQAIDKLEQYDRENRAVHNALQRIGVLSLLALATHKQERTDDALAILDRAIALGEPGGIIQPLADLGPEMAALLQELVSCRVAVGSLSPATATYLNRVFAAFVVPTAERAQAVLGQLASFAAGPMSPLLVEPLTEREMEVLVLLAQRLTNQEIAQKLVISLGTVKQHTHNIYGKLGVQDRRQAVARALELELLSPP